MREDKVIEIKDKIIEIKVAIEGIEQSVERIAYAEEKVDWEQRRYEIAKDILATSHIAQQIGQYGYHEEIEVKFAVQMADLLIAELKKKE